MSAPPPGLACGRWRSSDWLHLVYLGALVFQPAFDPTAHATDWLLAAGIAVAFLPLYVAGTLRPDRARWWCTVPTVVLAAAALPINSGASVLFVYAAASAGTTERPRVARRWLIALTALLGAWVVVSPVPLPYRLLGLVPSLIFIPVVGLLQIEEAARDRDTDGLRVDSARIGHLATVSERERIARDLHDLLGHSFTNVILRAQLVQRLCATDPVRAAAEAAEIEVTARRALGEVRTAVTGWRQASLDAELRSAEQALAVLGVAFEVIRDPAVAPTPAAERALALALREAVTNVARHAAARTCQVRLDSTGREVRLVVSDDGVGGDAPEGNGLAGLRERVAALGGRVSRSTGAGTTLTVVVPAADP